MARERPASRDSLVETIRDRAGSIRAMLSQLSTRKKTPDTPAPAPHKPVPEGPRWGQLVLLEKVGEGSFAEVYRAWDPALEREVALKLLRAVNEDPTLVQEARMLARVRHPNVVLVYGVDRHNERSGVWMDFIEGQTLGTIVAQWGPLGPREALLVGVDVCRALAAVHQSDLLHRDIKAQNVMRERGGRIVLMDFGLGHDIRTAVEDFGGTPLYMAPEVLNDQPATVRSDLYAVGVLLFHLVTDAYPATGSSIEELRAAHAAGKANLHDLRTDLPPQFVQAVEKALAPEPGRRFASAGQMIDALETALGRGGFSLRITRRAFWWAASPLAALGAAWVVIKRLQPSVSVSAGASLFLTDISNATADQQLDAVTEVLRNQLAQSAHFNLLEAGRVRETLTMMTRPPDARLDLPLAREVALRSKTPLLLYGTLSPLGAGYGLSLVLEKIEGQPRTPRAGESKLFEARSKAGLFDAIHQAATWVRQTAGEATKDILERDTQPEEATTASWEALDYFTQAERLKEQRRSTDAISMYKQAVRIDPDFALALARIAQEEGAQRQDADSFVYWRKAVDALQKRHATRREELRIRGLQASMTEDFGSAEDILHSFTLLYPQDPLAHHYRALALRNLGRLEEARAELLSAQRLRADEVSVVNLTVIALLLGRLQEATGYLGKLRQTFERYYGGLAKVLANDFEGADAAFSSVLNSDDTRLRSLAFGAKAALLADLGRFAESASVLEAGIRADAATGNIVDQARKRLAIAHLQLMRGQRQTARDLALEAARQDPDTLNLLRAGGLTARAEFPNDARRILEEMNSPAEGRRFETARAILNAEIASAVGRVEDAVDGFHQADGLAAPIDPREFLARGWDRLGRREDALSSWQRIARAPALVWLRANFIDPGIWTESLLRVAELSKDLGRPAEARSALSQFLKIREHAEPGSPQSVSAQKLLSVL